MVTNKIFFDTNIVLDLIDKNRLSHSYAVELWENSIIQDYEIFISEDTLSTIFYVNKNNNKNTLEFLQLIFKRWQIVSFGEDVIKSAIGLSIEKNLDLEDVLQCLCAKNNDCKAFITNDVKFHNCGLDIYTAKEFLEYMKES